jgi:hypothetical protein
VIDAHPEDMNMVDYYKPDGTPVMRTVGDYRQTNDALFHAGTNSGSQYEYDDSYNHLHFYLLDRYTDAQETLHYVVGVQNPTGAGPQTRGVSVANADPVGLSVPSAYCHFPLTNSGTDATTDPALHPQDETAYLHNDIYRLTAGAQGAGWHAELPNGLATARFGDTVDVPVYVTRDAGRAASGVVTLTATSVSDTTKTDTATCAVSTSPTAVALRSFSARRAGAHTVALRWRTGAETGFLGFALYREGQHLKRALIPAQNAAGGGSYTYRDRVSKRAPARYELQAVKLDGSHVWLGSARTR